MSSFLLVTPWAIFAIACRWSAMCFLLTITATFLELGKNASEKFSVLLRYQARSLFLRSASTGHSLGIDAFPER